MLIRYHRYYSPQQLRYILGMWLIDITISTNQNSSHLCVFFANMSISLQLLNRQETRLNSNKRFHDVASVSEPTSNQHSTDCVCKCTTLNKQQRWTISQCSIRYIIYSINSEPKYCNAFNPLTAKLFNLNFHPREVVFRWRDPQLQVSENDSDLTKWRLTLFKSCWLMSNFIFNIFKMLYLIKNENPNICDTGV